MQKDYPLYPQSGRAGLVADNAPSTIDSFVAETAIFAGSPLIRGTETGQVKAASVTADAANIFGIAVFGYKHSEEESLYTKCDTVPVLRRGRIYVPVSGAVTPGKKAKLVIEGSKAKFADVGTDIGIDITFETESENSLAIVSI